MSRVGVWGAGREGRAAARYLAARGDEVVLADDSAEVARPADVPDEVAFVAGEGARAALLAQESVVASPGVPRTDGFRLALAEAGVRVTTGSALWMADHAAATIGVTGTKGKSTTSSMLATLLRAAGVPAQLAGNIGIPLLDADPAAPVTVAELSSYQCAYLETSPGLAVLTNLFEDHLPWHGGREQYWRDKARVFTEGAATLVTTAETAERLRGAGIALPADVRVLDAGTDFDDPAFPVPPRAAQSHNRRNWRLAVLAAETRLGRALTRAELAAAADAFAPLPHRLDPVSTKSGLTWVDDTLATTPQAAAAALEATPGQVVIVLGGDDRGIDYTPLTTALAAHSARLQVIAIPLSGARATAAFRALHLAPVHDAGSLAEAVRLAAALAAPGATVLLSPAAPSHNEFRSFEEKSAAFRAAIDAL